MLGNYDTTACVLYVYISPVTRSSVTFLQWLFNHSRDMFWRSCVKVEFASGICSKKFIVFFFFFFAHEFPLATYQKFNQCCLNSLSILSCLCTWHVKNYRFPTERLNFSGDPSSSVEVAGAWMSFLRLPR